MKEGSEKLCDICGEKHAVVHLTQVVDNETIHSHLCEECAARKGVSQPTPPPGSLPLADFLATMGAESPAEPDADPGAELSCPFCGLLASDFKEVGRLGCPQCYTTFEPALRSLLRRIHGGTQHVGKVYLPPDPTAREREKRLDGLRKRLRRAVDAEDFERAAELRDEIRAMEPAQ
jgi:protein arginine kinase activator